MADPAIPHLILVGLPGSGKSTIGPLLADRLGRPFLDFDVELSRREGMSIPEIFGLRGEAHFRELEHRLTEELREVGGMVLSPGGGWVARPGNVELLRPPGRLVYLQIGTATAVARMGSAASGRPLLDRPNPEAALDRLLSARISAYESADLVVRVDRLDPQEVADQILTLLRG